MDKADMKRIGNRLRACRKQADLTQEELGEMVGFSKIIFPELNGDSMCPPSIFY